MTKAVISGFMAGALFGAGLAISGMTNPANIKGFLDISGDFKPGLALVMVGAIVVHAAFLRLPVRRAVATTLSTAPPSARRVDVSLVAGAAIFGVGWGLGGYCPGPSIVALGAGSGGALVFVAASVVGLLLSDVVQAALAGSSRRIDESTEQGEVVEVS